MWFLRKFYAGNGGCLPPTDPRILAMTPEQIELEFTHMLLDKSEKEAENQVYVDSEFEDYDNETEGIDSRLSDDLPPPNELPKTEFKEEDWEDVEDFEDLST